MKMKMAATLLAGLVVAGAMVAATYMTNASNGIEAILETTTPDPLLNPEYEIQEAQTATFALGCFWAPDGLFGIIPGVIRTRVGYSGGTSESPTYRNIDGHAEAIQIDFDPAIVSYKDLLQVFWASHNPFSSTIYGQYRSIIFAHNEEQMAAAESSAANLQTLRERTPTTKIVRFELFTRAEDYHQKYRLQGTGLLDSQLKERFTTFEKYVDSTMVARINGYVSGWGSPARLEEEIDYFGLSDEAAAALRAMVH